MTTKAAPITNDYYLSSYSKPVKETGNSNLGKDAFLQLLITQLQNQDPTNPMDDRDFIAQMAQFSSLEQMQNMTTAMNSLLESQQQSQLMNYSTFIGKEVQWHEITEEKDAEGKFIVANGTGSIKSLKFVDGEAVFTLADGKEISPGNISGIIGNIATTSSSSSTVTPIVQASMLIGKKVSYTVEDTEVQAKVVSVSSKDGNISYILDNQAKVTGDQINGISE